jgi:putative transposase
VINALRNKYQLKQLLVCLKIAKSSYCYQNRALNTPDKYRNLRSNVRQKSTECYRSYGYKRIHSALKSQGIAVSEKVVRRIMHQENLAVVCTTQRKYSSYVGEVSPDVPNLVQRNFHVEVPDKLYLTDIKEFYIPAGRIYMSPISNNCWRETVHETDNLSKGSPNVKFFMEREYIEFVEKQKNNLFCKLAFIDTKDLK